MDLGASRGRVVTGVLRDGCLSIEVVHRFEHAAQPAGGRKRWDFELINREIDRGLFAAAERAGGGEIASLSCDSWAQDFGLVDEAGRLAYAPVCYRDSRTQGMPGILAKTLPPGEIFRQNGSTLSPITTLCQLAAMVRDEPEVLHRPVTLLFVADLIHSRLCGSRVTDATFATASQLRSLRHDGWNREILLKLGIPQGVLPPVLKAPAVIGRVRAEAAPHPRLIGVPVIAGAGHDTAAASAAIPSLGDGTLFLILGTWAMLGCCLGAEPQERHLTDDSLALLGLPWRRWGLFAGCTGMWPLQECLREWSTGGLDLGYEALELAAQKFPSEIAVDLGAPRFFAPSRMTEAIATACRESGLSVPAAPGEFTALILRSLAWGIAGNTRRLAAVTGRDFTLLRLVGGGSRSGMLCRRLAANLGFPVLAGPAEATAIGNILVQARTLGVLRGENETAEVLERSFAPLMVEA